MIEGAVRRYLRPASDSVWRFGDDGTALTWRDGETVTLHGELETVLEHLPASGVDKVVFCTFGAGAEAAMRDALGALGWTG